MRSVTAATLYKEQKEHLQLEVVVGEDFLARRKITTYDVFRPGLALAGYTGYFLSDRIMILGKTETSYLKTLKRSLRDKRISKVVRLGTPCIIVAKGLDVDKTFLKQAQLRKIPVLRTSLSTTPFIHSLSAYLEYKLAPVKCVQGTLVDIYGVGVLFIGKPGTGKSECALDLIERGHRLVADDLVRLVKRGDILIGYGAEKSQQLKHHIEIRGVGIVDIFRIFGVKSVRLRKRVETIVELVLWDEVKGEYDRTGLQKKTKKFLGISIPSIIIPLTPGKNVSVIAEVIAMNHLLALRGIYPAKEYDVELRRVLASMQVPSVHYDEDIE
jgi:HPr kinase/phosphorylase